MAHLVRCDASFVPRLSERVELADYATKLYERAVTFEAWQDKSLVGLVAAYVSESPGGEAYVTNVSVEDGFHGRGVASALLGDCIRRAREGRMRRVRLEVAPENQRAVGLYRKLGFRVERCDPAVRVMTLTLEETER